MANKSLAKSPTELTILVTGGAGFIGSHTCVELLAKGFNVVIVDDLSNSSEVAVERVRKIAGVGADRCAFHEANVLDRDAMEAIFSEHDIDAIIHFAGFKAVGESVQKPLEYYWNNIAGTLVLCDVARNHGVKNIVFSSSATVYGEPEFVPITEDCPKHSATNPYGQTKTMLEQVLTDLYVGDNEWNVVLLRYFNPIGAHPSGLIGEDPRGVPNNLMPYISQTAIGRRECLSVFGDDYDTPDGTGVRDYIHVMDLARGHVAAIAYMAEHTGESIFNLGTGKGYSVLEMVHAFETANHVHVPYRIAPRRAGDLPTVYACPDKSARILGWRAEYSLEDMCRDSWHWQTQNPNGYETA